LRSRITDTEICSELKPVLWSAAANLWRATMTPLDKPIRREVKVGKEVFTLTIDPAGLKFVPKGKRKGFEMTWASLANGDAAIAAALQASLN
jgi:hypothetical protein